MPPSTTKTIQPVARPHPCLRQSICRVATGETQHGRDAAWTSTVLPESCSTVSYAICVYMCSMSEAVLPSSLHRDTTVAEATADKTTEFSLSRHPLGFDLAASCVAGAQHTSSIDKSLHECPFISSHSWLCVFY